MKKESKLKEITEQEFKKVCFETQEVYMKEIRDSLADMQTIDIIQNQVTQYKILGYKVVYFINQETQSLSYVTMENKIGFGK